MSDSDCTGSKICVDIQRNDGRIHSAFITLINAVNQNVMVQWKENGELKGKEICLDDIVGLNPNIFDDLSSQISSISNISTLRNGIGEADAVKYSQLKKIKSQRILKVNNDENIPISRSSTIKNKNLGLIKSGCNGQNKISHSINLNKYNSEKSQEYRFSERSPQDRTLAVKSIVEQLDLPAGLITLISSEEGSLTSNTGKPVVGSNLQNRVVELNRQVGINKEHPNWAVKNSKKLIGANNYLHICVHVKESQYNGVVYPRQNLISINEPNKLLLHTPSLTSDAHNIPLKFEFEFDSVYSTRQYSTSHVYRSVLQPAIQSLLKNINKKIGSSSYVSCLLYDCTSTDCKSSGSIDTSNLHNSYLKEMYCMTVSEIFRRVDKFNHSKDHCRNLYALYLNAFEISNKKIFDLLNRRVNIDIVEDHRGRIGLSALKEEKISRTDDLHFLYKIAGNAALKPNQVSRNHVIFKISIKHENTRHIIGHFYLISLATSSFQSKDAVSDSSPLSNILNHQELSEKKLLSLSNKLHEREVSKSLRALRECLRAIGRTGAYIPSKVSRLTQVLRDSFQSTNSYACLLGTLDGNFALSSTSTWLQSLNSLRYLDSIKELSGPMQFNTTDSSSSPSFQKRLVSPVINAADNLIPNQIIPEDDQPNSNILSLKTSSQKNKERYSDECESVFETNSEYTLKSNGKSLISCKHVDSEKYFKKPISGCDMMQQHGQFVKEIKSWINYHETLASKFEVGDCNLNEFADKVKLLILEHSNKIIDIYEKIEKIDGRRIKTKTQN